MNELQQKLKEREALENAYGNFVEPHINQWIALSTQTITTPPNPHIGLYCTSGWLLLTLIYCHITKRR